MSEAHPIPALFDLNCFLVASIEAATRGGVVRYGWAHGPAGRAQHCWVLRDGAVVDLLHWTDHEDMGARDAALRSTLREAIGYLRGRGARWPQAGLGAKKA